MSALAAPAASFGGVPAYPSLIDQAACLLYHVVKDHPCPDGNKRLGVLLLYAFLGENGFTLTTNDDDLADQAERVAASRSEDRAVLVSELKNWIYRRLTPSRV